MDKNELMILAEAYIRQHPNVRLEYIVKRFGISRQDAAAIQRKVRSGVQS